MLAHLLCPQALLCISGLLWVGYGCGANAGPVAILLHTQTDYVNVIREWQAGWFPEWTLTEDFALGIELKKLSWQVSPCSLLA
jgi:hypothetical protein